MGTEILQNTGQTVGSVETAANDLSTFYEKSSELLSGTADEAKFMKISNQLGKLGAGFGVLGVAISLIDNQPSDTDKILSAIGKLDKKITQLGTSIDDHFQTVTDQLDVLENDLTIYPATNSLDTLKQHILSYWKFKVNGDTEKMNDVVNTLLGYKVKDIDTWANNIWDHAKSKDLITTDDTNFTNVMNSKGIWNAYYTISYGKLGAIASLGQLLMDRLSFAYIGHVLIKTLQQNTRDDLAAIQGVADEYYQPKLNDVNTAWNAFMNYCIHNWEVNMENKLESEVFSTLSTSHETSAKSLWTSLSEQWPWLKWFTIVYDPISGSSHTVGGYNIKSWFRHPIKGGTANIVVKWINPNEKTAYREWNTDSNYTEQVTHYEMYGGSYTSTDPTSGPAEDAGTTKARELYNSLSKTVPYPGAVFICRLGHGVHSYNNFGSKVLWKNGTTWTVGILGLEDEVNEPGLKYYNNVIISKHSGQLLTLNPQDRSSLNLVQWPFAKTELQQWNVTLLNNGYYKIETIYGRVLEVGSSEDVHLAPEYNGSDSQLYKLIPEKNGCFVIKNKKTDKVLDISGRSTAAGTKLIQYEANGGENQQFFMIPYVVESYGK